MAGKNRQEPLIRLPERRAATSEAATAALDELRAELESKGVAVKDGRWGYRLLVVDDPDGNQLLFNYPHETVSSQE